jgi:regulator of cell morphogenesis and NO signaling
MEKTMDTSDKTIGEIVADDYRTAKVFEHHGIDFCCGGNVALAATCTDKGLDLATITTELEAVQRGPVERSQNYASWELPFLADYIINAHHTYLKENTGPIAAYAQKIAGVHGAHHPELIEIATIFDKIAVEMAAHLREEEEVCFPAMKRAYAAGKAGAAPAATDLGTIQTSLTKLRQEHEGIGEAVHTIRHLAKDYAIPGDVCCGGTLHVRSSTVANRRAFYYGCSSYHLRGTTVCTNKLNLPKEAADQAVLGVIAQDLLRPEVVEGAIRRATEQWAARGGALEAQRVALRKELQQVEGEIANLTAAIANGGQLTALLAGLKEREERRTQLQEQLISLERRGRPCPSRWRRSRASSVGISRTGGASSPRTWPRRGRLCGSWWMESWCSRRRKTQAGSTTSFVARGIWGGSWREPPFFQRPGCPQRDSNPRSRLEGPTS